MDKRAEKLPVEVLKPEEPLLREEEEQAHDALRERHRSLRRVLGAAAQRGEVGLGPQRHARGGLHGGGDEASLVDARAELPGHARVARQHLEHEHLLGHLVPHDLHRRRLLSRRLVAEEAHAALALERDGEAQPALLHHYGIALERQIVGVGAAPDRLVSGPPASDAAANLRGARERTECSEGYFRWSYNRHLLRIPLPRARLGVAQDVGAAESLLTDLAALRHAHGRHEPLRSQPE